MRKIILACSVSATALAFNSERCPVVVVKGADNQPVRINREDYEANKDAFELVFDGDIDEMGVADTPAPEAADTAPQPPVQMVVTKEGKGEAAKFFVTDSAKHKIGDMNGDDGAGYTSESDAWAAIMAKAAPQQ